MAIFYRLPLAEVSVQRACSQIGRLREARFRRTGALENLRTAASQPETLGHPLVPISSEKHRPPFGAVVGDLHPETGLAASAEASRFRVSRG